MFEEKAKKEWKRTADKYASKIFEDKERWNSRVIKKIGQERNAFGYVWDRLAIWERRLLADALEVSWDTARMIRHRGAKGKAEKLEAITLGILKADATK